MLSESLISSSQFASFSWRRDLHAFAWQTETSDATRELAVNGEHYAWARGRTLASKQNHTSNISGGCNV